MGWGVVLASSRRYGPTGGADYRVAGRPDGPNPR